MKPTFLQNIGFVSVYCIDKTTALRRGARLPPRSKASPDEVVYGDSGYLGIEKRPEVISDEHLSSIDYRINRRPKKLPKVSDNAIDWERFIENRKSSVRCKVEHAFRIIKCQFNYRKTVYRGLKKNENRLYAMFACANLYAIAIAGRKLSTT